MYSNGIVKLATSGNAKLKLLVNGHHLCLYKKPLTKVEFMQQFDEFKTSASPTAIAGGPSEPPQA